MSDRRNTPRRKRPDINPCLGRITTYNGNGVLMANPCISIRHDGHWHHNQRLEIMARIRRHNRKLMAKRHEIEKSEAKDKASTRSKAEPRLLQGR